MKIAAAPCSWMVASSLFVATPAFSSILLDENFDELTPASAATSVGTFSTINGTNVDIVGDVNGNFFPALCALPESGNCIDMNGSGGNPQGQLQSNTAFGPGNYLLSFDLIGNQRGSTSSVTVTFGNYNGNSLWRAATTPMESWSMPW
jgi:hypothetical protein